jgi:nucleoside-diphosphate-sugar epimerase
LSGLPLDQRPELVTLVSRSRIGNLNEQTNVRLKIHYVQADLLDTWNFDRSVTHILQLAADGSEHSYSQRASDDFVVFARRLIEWVDSLSQKPVVMHVSSGACFGYFPLNADGLQSFPSNFGLSKSWSKASFVEGRLEVERSLRQACGELKFDLKVARLYSFIGKHIKGKIQYAVPSFISMAKNSGSIRLTGDPMTIRSYLSAHDMSAWIFSALEKDQELPLLSIGSSIPVRMIDLAEFIAEQFSARVVLSDHYEIGDIYVADNARTKELLNVDETISWQQAILDLIKVY